MTPAASAPLILQLQVHNASTTDQINEAFASLARERTEALLVAPESFFATRRVQLAILEARYRVPAIASTRDHPAAGGLMSYGTDIADSYRWIGMPARDAPRLQNQRCDR
jgi:putative ABC transport system substrate-binding protein